LLPDERKKIEKKFVQTPNARGEEKEHHPPSSSPDSKPGPLGIPWHCVIQQIRNVNQSRAATRRLVDSRLLPRYY
jgi:hypothetical protein